MTALRLALFMLALIARSVFAQASPDEWRAEGWETDFGRRTVAFSEILSGGPPRDGIPSIDNPKFEKAASTEQYKAREPVIELRIGGIARAYPLSILIWHEIVNDTVAGLPVAVTYCPLCNSSIAFDRRLDGRVLDFGTTGKLRNSDLVMYDRETQSWWQQFTGEAIIGQFTGKSLKMIPSRVTAFEDFTRRNPDGEVLVPNDPARRNYGSNPYVGYDSRSGPYPLFDGRLPAGINAMERVVIVRREDGMIAVTLEHLRMKEQLKLDGVALSWTSGVASALDQEDIARSREVGAVDATDASTGRPLVHEVTFAFVLFAFHPDVPVLTPGGLLRMTANQQVP